MANHLTLPELDAGWFADAALEQPLSPSLADIFKSDADSGAESGLHARAHQVLANPRPHLHAQRVRVYRHSHPFQSLLGFGRPPQEITHPSSAHRPPVGFRRRTARCLHCSRSTSAHRSPYQRPGLGLCTTSSSGNNSHSNSNSSSSRQQVHISTLQPEACVPPSLPQRDASTQRLST